MWCDERVEQLRRRMLWAAEGLREAGRWADAGRLVIAWWAWWGGWKRRVVA